LNDLTKTRHVPFSVVYRIASRYWTQAVYVPLRLRPHDRLTCCSSTLNYSIAVKHLPVILT